MCSTTSVRSNFKFNYHIFGQQEASFQDVKLSGDMLLIARFYLRKQLNANKEYADGGPQYGEEQLVAWAVLPMIQSTQGGNITLLQLLLFLIIFFVKFRF